MNTKPIQILGVMLLLLLSSSLKAAEQHTKDTLETVQKNLQDKKAILLDVREQNEWDAGHLKAARLMPLSKLRAGADPQTLVKEIDKETILYCHCRSGGRALVVSGILKKLGYDIRPLKQGYADLVTAGFVKAE